jgi:hypothetical protein
MAWKFSYSGLAYDPRIAAAVIATAAAAVFCLLELTGKEDKTKMAKTLFA